MRAAALLCGLATLASCARPLAPPGGERDQLSPRLLSTVPEPLAVVDAGTQPVVFRFDEKISERGFSEALVSVSPLDSALRIDRSGDEIRVSIDGGWRPNRVYRVVLLPGIRDLFGNERRDAVELVFSTGAPVGNTALAGMVLDRLTGLPTPLGIVEATHRTEGARYTAMTDSSGFYSLRYLPVGEYDVRAWDDLNRNRRRDTLEPVDSGHAASLAASNDTVALVFSVLSPDTTAPRVASARSLDSLHVQVETDDYFDPAAGLAAVAAEVLALPDSTRYPTAIRVMTLAVHEQERSTADSARAAAEAAARDTALSRDTAAADTAAVRSEVVPVPGARPGGRAAVDPTLPVRAFVVRLDRPLPPGQYLINVGGVRNLHGLTGGGIAPFDVSAPAPVPPPAPPDTTRSGG